MLDLLCADIDGRVVESGELQARYVLTRLRALAVEHPDILEGRIAQLQRLDDGGRTDYVATLAALFACGGDVPRAARALFLHPNTLRYRLRRIGELTGLDLADPVDRLVAELQLRLLLPEDAA
jgi:DNA-binding PucR family transcriptional regulator